jgi:hypothetical protein
MSNNNLLNAKKSSEHLKDYRRMRKASIVLAVLATTLASGASPAQALEGTAPQAQETEGPTLGGHIGFVLPLVTQSGGQTTSLADAPAVGFPVGITVREVAAPPSTSNLSHNTMQPGNG